MNPRVLVVVDVLGSERDSEERRVLDNFEHRYHQKKKMLKKTASYGRGSRQFPHGSHPPDVSSPMGIRHWRCLRAFHWRERLSSGILTVTVFSHPAAHWRRDSH